MKKLILLVLLAALSSCGSGASTASKTDTVPVDTSFSGRVISKDTTGAGRMNADTAGMGQAR